MPKTPLLHWLPFAILLLVLSIIPINNNFHGGTNKDYPMWFETGQKVLHNISPYPSNPAASFDFMYPPSCSGLLAVAGIAGKLAFIIILVLICSASWVLCLRLIDPLAIDNPVRRTTLENGLILIVPTCIVIGYAWGIYLLGQPIIFLLACLMGALYFQQKNRPFLSGGLIALAAAIKAFPILALGWFIFRRQWKACLACILWLAIFLLVVPAIFRGPQGAWHDLATWTRGTFKYNEQGIAQRAARGGTWRNGSVMSVVNRLLRPVIAENEPNVPNPPDLNSPAPAVPAPSATTSAAPIPTTNAFADGPPLYVNFANASFQTVNLVVALITLTLGALFLLSAPRHKNRTPQTDRLEYAMFLLLMMIFTPLSFTYTNFWVMFPVALTLQFILDPRWPDRARRILLAALLLFVALTFLSIPILPIFHTLRAMGNTLAANILLLFMLAYQMHHLRRTTI